MTLDSLKTQTRKELAALAREYHVAGWHSMRKDQLIQALLTAARRIRRRAARRRPTVPTTRRLKTIAALLPCPVEELIAAARGPYWVRVQWNLSPRGIERARAALGLEWHRAAPVLRVFDDRGNDDSADAARSVRDVEIHGETDHWYVPVENPPGCFQFAIGYRTAAGRFFALARSRPVRTPRPGDDAPEPNGSPSDAGMRAVEGISRRFGGLRPTRFAEDVRLQLDAELVLRGSTAPGTEVTCMGRQVQLAEDGTFLLRVPLPNGRQVIPAVAVIPGSPEQRTVVLAVERNTKELEPRNLNEPLF